MVALSLWRTRLEESKGALRSWKDNLLQALLPLTPQSPSSENLQVASVSALLDKCIQMQAAILQRDQVRLYHIALFALIHVCCRL